MKKQILKKVLLIRYWLRFRYFFRKEYENVFLYFISKV